MRERGVGDWFRKNNAATLKTFMNYLAKNYGFPKPDFPMPKVHKTKKFYLEPDDIRNLIKSDLSERENIIVRLFLTTGIRMNELVQLDWKDINFKTGAIAITGKGDKFRFVVTDKKTLVILLRYKNKHQYEPETPVISTKDGRRITTRGLRSIIVRMRERIKIYYTPHGLRRTFARQAVLNGMGIEFLQQLMGHSNLDLTKSYVGELDVNDLVLNYNKHPIIS